MPYRVVQWSTGHVGLRALDAIFDNPALELVGLWVHSEVKVGLDAGEMVGRPACGVLATNDVDAILDLAPDVVCYTATADLRPSEAVEDICRILASGANVVSSSLVQLLHPKTADRSLVDPLEAACKEGGTTCFFNGIDPGFGNDLLPIVLTGLSQRITEVRVREILNYATYDQAEVLFDTMGFGQALDSAAHAAAPRHPRLRLGWGRAHHRRGDRRRARLGATSATSGGRSNATSPTSPAAPSRPAPRPGCGSRCGAWSMAGP